MSLHVKAFPDCCGISIISGFGKTSTTLITNNSTISETRKDLERIIKKYSNKQEYEKVGLLLVSLNQDQVPLFQDDLLSLGFNVIQPAFYHHNHGKSITLYGYVCFSKETFGDKNFKVGKDYVSDFKKKFEESVQISPGVLPRSRKVK